MKIKLGDWVQYNSTGNIEKVTKIEHGEKYINRVDVKDCNKLPIKFKPFEILTKNDGSYSFISELRRISKGEEILKFHAIKKPNEDTCTDVYYWWNGNYYSWTSGIFTTIEEVRDWMELRYAEIFARAKNLI